MKISEVHHLFPSVCFTVTPWRDLASYIDHRRYPFHDEAYQTVRLQALESQHFRAGLLS